MMIEWQIVWLFLRWLFGFRGRTVYHKPSGAEEMGVYQTFMKVFIERVCNVCGRTYWTTGESPVCGSWRCYLRWYSSPKRVAYISKVRKKGGTKQQTSG